MKTLEEIKQQLVQNKSLAQERYKVRELGVLGFYFRQEQTETSSVTVYLTGLFEKFIREKRSMFAAASLLVNELSD